MNLLRSTKRLRNFTLTESISEAKEIRLDHNQNFFSFTFASLDYKNPAKIHYEYMLEGFDNEWVVCKSTPVAHYTNVKPGKYTFIVRATNSDGVWSKNIAQLKVIITPPFWKTTLFYILLSLFVLLLIYAIYKFRIKALEREKRFLETEVQKRTHEINKINLDLKKSNSFNESVINNADYGITVVNQKGDIILANPAASLITGYSQDELLKMNFKELTPQKWIDIDETVLDDLTKNGQSSFRQKEYIRKDGTIIKVAISSSYIKDYDFPAFVNIINDITERVANEKELQAYRTNLETLVKERTTDLISAKERAEKADRLKTAFLSNISHEIRTPMNSIMGFSNLLRSQSCEPDQLNDYLECITEGSRNLLNIVTNIVEISKISADDITLSMHKFNFTRFINEIYTSFHRKVLTKGLDFTLDYNSTNKELWILADESKLTSIMNHLLDNALKFTHKGNITISFDIVADQILVCIQDTGIGVSSDLQEDIFEPFKQADTTLSRAYGGSGLGLTISKAYVEKMGGRIWLESKQDKGSKFCFSFPFVRCEEGTNATYKIGVSFKKLNILIVEDEHMNYRYLSEILKNKAQNLYYAPDGYSAIEQCRNNPNINMVLMDIKLPDINGLEATTEIKKFRPDLTIIAQTAYTLIGDKEKALSAGCDDYISKPINKENLYSIISKHLKE